MSDDENGSRTVHPGSLSQLGRRLSAVLDEIGTRRKAADVANRSTDQLAKYEKGLTEPPFSAIASLCLAAGVRMEWVATGIGEMHNNPWEGAQGGNSQPLRPDELTIALQLASEALGDKVLPPAKYAELVVLIYELLDEGLPEAKVLRFARAAA